MIKQTENFDGENFSDWKFKLRHTIMTYGSDKLLSFLDKASNMEKEIKAEEYDAEHKDELEFLSKTLYNILACKLKEEPMILLKNVDNMNGLETWRKLNVRYDSKTIGKRVALIRKMVSPPKIKLLKDVSKTIESWEDTIRILKRDYKEDLPEGLRIGILLEMLPTKLAETSCREFQTSLTRLPTPRPRR